jgi:thioredoxin-dependent peroxiredoxin
LNSALPKDTIEIVEVYDMFKNKIPLINTVLCLIFIAISAYARMPEEGTVAPKFALKSQEGTEVRLDDLKGKWVVLYFYPKDFTSGCTLEAHNFQRDLAGYEKKNAVIIGISVDTVDSHKDFCAKEGLNFRLLADTDYRVSELYGSLMEYQGKPIAARNTFIIDPNGKIVKIFKQVQPAKHSEEVLATLEQLQGKTRF